MWFQTSDGPQWPHTWIAQQILPIACGFIFSVVRNLPYVNLISGAVISALKWHLSVHGTPHTPFSDNAQQYTCQHFKYFTKQWYFFHATGSPESLKSKGLVEKVAQAAKQLRENLMERKLTPSLVPWTSAIFLVIQHWVPLLSAMSRQIHTAIPVSTRSQEPAPKNTSHDS